MGDEIASHEPRDDTTGSRRGWIGRDVIVARLRRAQADPGLREDLAWIAGDTTGDLPPNR